MQVSLFAFLFLLLGANATSVAGVRDLPGRYIHSKTRPDKPVQNDYESAEAKLPDLVVMSKPDYIKSFLVFNSFNAVPATTSQNGPLNSKFTNLERHLSDESDLKSWTRYLVETSDEVTHSVAPPVDEIDLDIDRFVDYLITNRGFDPKDLAFLSVVPLDLSYDEIENELSRIREAAEEKEEPDIPALESMAPISTPSFILLLSIIAFLDCLR